MSERDEFEAWAFEQGFCVVRSGDGSYATPSTDAAYGGWLGHAARTPQAVPALTEPVAEAVSAYGDPEAFGEREIRALADLSRVPYGTKLYAAPQPSPEKCFRCGHAAHHGSCVNVAPRSED